MSAFAAAGGSSTIGPVDLDDLTPEQRRAILGVTAAPDDNVIDAGSQMFSTSSNSTGEKPQSKLWYHDGSYWGILRGPDGVAFYEKQGSTWVRGTFTGAVVASGGHADVKWTGSHLFVLIYASTSRLYEYTYNAGSRTWVLSSGFPVTVPNPSGSETMVLESDSNGRLWTAVEGGGSINVYYSTSADRRTWSSTPVVLRSGVGTDDICSIVAFGGNKVGVFWSDQNRDEFGFRYHNDSDSPTSWSSTEIADSGSGHADDHISLAFDSNGRVFAITKDDNDRMRVHRRNASGSWTTVTDVVGNIGTRGIIMVSEADSKIYILYTRWGVSPERIEYRVADINSMSFGGTVNFIDASGDMNNVTGMKQILPPGSLVAVASTSGSCYYNSFGNPPSGGGTQPPGAPSGLQASLQSGPQVGLTWSAPSGAVDGYHVFRQSNGGSFAQINSGLVGATSYTDTSPPTGSICYQVRAVRAGLQGNASNTSCVTNNPPAPPAAPTNVQASLQAGPQVGVTWTAPSGTIDGYNVYRQSNGGSFAKLNGALVTGTSYLDTAPPSGNLCYQVRSQRSGVESNASSSSCVDNTPPPTAPNAPTSLTASLVDVSTPPPGNLLLSMDFDEGSGQTVNDASGHGNHGTRGSSPGNDSADGTFTTGVANGALQFDGTNDRLEIPHAASLIPAGSFTIECWARRSGSSGTVISKGTSSTRTYRVRITSSGHVEFLWETSSGTTYETIASNAIGNSDWHHIACVYDQTGGENRVYVDGVLQASGSASGSPASNTLPVYLGVHLNGSSRTGYLSGAIDLLRIHPLAAYSANFTPPSSLGSGTTLAVTAPGGSSEIAAQRVDLAWQPPSGGTPAASYNVYRRVNGGASVAINGAPVTQTQFSDPNPVAGQLCYTVRAVSAAALEGPASGSACVNVGSPPPLPDAPTGLQATLQAGPQVALQWTAPSGTIDGYTVYRAVDGGTAAQITATPVTGTSFTDTNPPEGELCYTVTAFAAAAGEGPASGASCVTVDPVPPPPAPGEPQNAMVTIVSTPGSAASGAAAWPFDDASGDTAADFTGNGHAAQLGSASGGDSSDPVWAPGVAGSGALQFDGSNDRCVIPDAPGLRFAGSFTVEAWVKRDVIGSSHCVASKGDSQRRNYWVVISSSGRIDFRWETSSGANHGAESGVVIADTQWHHLACVYDQAAGQSRIYVDGVLVRSESDSGTPVTSDDPVYIGTRLSSGSFTNYFRGSIDLVRVAGEAIYTSDFTPATTFGAGPAQTVAQVEWEPPLTGTAAGYNVYRRVNGGAFAQVNSSLVVTTSFADANPPTGTLCYQITAVDALSQEGLPSGTACTSVVSATKIGRQPAAPLAARMDVGPNPFNPSTTISYSLPAAVRVQVTIYDVGGHRVATLVNGMQDSGAHRVVWNGRNLHGAPVASGTYFVTLEAGSVHLQRRVVLLK